MDSRDLLSDAIERVGQGVHRLLEAVDERVLGFRPDPDANTIAWLVWHLTRGQDSQIADAYELEQVWTSEGWVERFGLPFSSAAAGYGHSSEEVAAVRVPVHLLRSYYDATQRVTLAQIAATSDADLDRIVDRRWTPAVTLGVRLVSVMDDDMQHVGQAAYVRGVVLRKG